MLIYCMGREAEMIVTQLNVRPPRAAVEADVANNIATVPAEDTEETLYS